MTLNLEHQNITISIQDENEVNQVTNVLKICPVIYYNGRGHGSRVKRGEVSLSRAIGHLIRPHTADLGGILRNLGGPCVI